MKTIILYESHHHGNTEKLVKALAQGRDVEAVSVENAGDMDLESYDLIGFASGIDFGKFYPAVVAMAKKLPEHKRVFALYTCGMCKEKMGEEIQQIAEERQCTFVGKFGCKGYNTYGPWKVIGGINKVHPDDTDISNGARFLEGLLKME